MADLTAIFGGAFRVDTPLDNKELVQSPEIQLASAMQEHGIEPPAEFIADGNLHRFKNGASTKDKSGWYVMYQGDIWAGAFGCWRLSIDETWHQDIGRDLLANESEAMRKRVAEARARRDIELKSKHEQALIDARRIWNDASETTWEHPYLLKKNAPAYNGIRQADDGSLVLPIYHTTDSISTLQFIKPDGSKKFLSGGKFKGGYWWIPKEPNGNNTTVFVCEGYATAASIHRQTGCLVVIAFNASNLTSVVATVVSKVSDSQQIVIVADNDVSGVGKAEADKAASKQNGRVEVCLIPELGMDANDYASEYDLDALLAPYLIAIDISEPKESWLLDAYTFSVQPKAIKWLVKGWLQQQAAMMMFGPSGAGKSFIALDWCLHIACGLPSWSGHKVRKGIVVYLAGEGHYGIRSRVMAWCTQNKTMLEPGQMLVSSSGCDLDTPNGLQQVISELELLSDIPNIIVIDTLHRFMSGDENSSKDTRLLNASCDKLMKQFNCSILLVHHTGHSGERARGSSAWKATMDVEISVVPGKDDEPIQIQQTKIKDGLKALPINADLKSVVIPGWYDEDGDPVSSAVLITEKTIEVPMDTNDTIEQPPINDKLNKMITLLKDSWWSAKCTMHNGKPYVSRPDMKQFLTVNLRLSESSFKMYLSPNQKDKFIGMLLEYHIIESANDGWIIVDQKISSRLLTDLSLG